MAPTAMAPKAPPSALTLAVLVASADTTSVSVAVRRAPPSTEAMVRVLISARDSLVWMPIMEAATPTLAVLGTTDAEVDVTSMLLPCRVACDTLASMTSATVFLTTPTPIAAPRLTATLTLVRSAEAEGASAARTRSLPCASAVMAPVMWPCTRLATRL